MQLTGRTDMAAEFVKGKNGIRCESYELYGTNGGVPCKGNSKRLDDYIRVPKWI